MLLSALLISESKAEYKLLTADPLFLITVDSQKTFDVVNHIIMLDKCMKLECIQPCGQ